MSRDVTIRATRRKLEENGYCVTSATNPSRMDNMRAYAASRALSFHILSDHPAAVLTYPTPFHAPEFQNESRAALSRRGIVVMVLTAYLLSDPRQTKAVMSVLDRAKLTSGPFRADGFGNREYPLRWDAHEPLFDTREARQAYPDDDSTVIFKRQAIRPSYRHDLVGQWGQQVSVATSEIGTDILELAGEWHQGHPLNTTRADLPELIEDELKEIIHDVERARWGARPAATSKEAA